MNLPKRELLKYKNKKMKKIKNNKLHSSEYFTNVYYHINFVLQLKGKSYKKYLILYRIVSNCNQLSLCAELFTFQHETFPNTNLPQLRFLSLA